MAKVIADNLNKVEGLHFKLVANLAQQDLLRETIFISTNYDIVIDNSLELHYKSQVGMLDYGVDFVNFDKPGEQATRLYKIHGSFNWLYCPTCNNLTLTRYKKGVLELIRIMEDSRRPGGPSHKYLDDTFKWMNHGLVEDVGRARCDVCRSLRVPVIVPPTFFKDMSKVFLSLIWNKAENALRQVDRIIFCGYSFPDADLHIKYLLKRVQTNRDKKIDFIIINNPSKDSGIKKTTKQKEEEEARYNRFLGGKVDYTNNSFTDFVSHPESFYLKSRVARSSRASSKRRAASGRVKSSRPVK